MPLTRTKFIRLLRTVALVVILAGIAGYAVWRSFAYAQGPHIEIYAPMNGSTVASSTVEIVGRAVRINALSINGNSLSVDEAGNFKDTRVVFPGMNILTLRATDQFGRSTQTQITVIGKAPRNF